MRTGAFWLREQAVACRTAFRPSAASKALTKRFTCFISRSITFARCPACQRFQPEYEKVAAFFAARGEAEPVITVARLDCANFVRLWCIAVLALALAGAWLRLGCCWPVFQQCQLACCWLAP